VKIYTRQGDLGETSLWRGGKVSKADSLIQAIGAIDELNAYLGICIAALTDSLHAALGPSLARCQRDLFEIGAELADGKGQQRITQARVSWLEEQIDSMSSRLPQLTHFVLPGGSLPAAHLHAARTIARRAERALVALHLQHPLQGELLSYINRLSDYLFSAARFANTSLGVEEPTWSGKDG